MTTTQRGLFIVFEGIDGAGKTTQVDLLQRFFTSTGVSCVRSKEPTDGPWGRKLRASATSGRMSAADELHAFIEDRKEHVRNLIQPALHAGKVVILDRYFYSTIAYQGVKGADAEAIERSMLSQFPIPDVVFLIDVPVPSGIDRVKSGRGETPNGFEQLTGLESARILFLDMARRHQNIHVMNGSDTIESLHAAVRAVLSAGTELP